MKSMPFKFHLESKPLRVRITWAPFVTPVEIHALEVGGVPLLPGHAPAAAFYGGEVEFALPVRLLAGLPRLRWVLSCAGGIDEIRIEICDALGRFHLLGELLGQEPGRHEWSAERALPGFLPVGLGPGSAVANETTF